MVKHVRIHEGAVVEIAEPHPMVDVENLFHPDSGFIKVDDDVDVAVGMIHENGMFSAPPPPEPEDPEAVWARVKRNTQALLAQSAWTQAPDEPPEFRTRWAAYRDKLRKFMAAGDPDAVLPEPPE